MREEKGITLIALVITIIILSIVAGIGIGVMNGMGRDIRESKSAIAVTDLKKVQQLVLETYTKYMQGKNTRLLKGEQIDYNTAKNIANEFGVELRQEEYNSSDDAINFYYKLTQYNLREMGMNNVNKDAQYIVNYKTGEVFDNLGKKTITGDVLYVYGK